MRLIDADNFKKFLHNLQDAGAEHVDFDDLHKFLDGQTTAYDVDKVVEKLKYNIISQIGKDGVTRIPLDKAIEIVKGGGVDGN